LQDGLHIVNTLSRTDGASSKEPTPRTRITPAVATFQIKIFVENISPMELLFLKQGSIDGYRVTLERLIFV